MESLKNAFEELAVKRITEVEFQKRTQTQWQTNEKRYDILCGRIQAILKQHGSPDDLEELIALQITQNYEMFTAIYLQGLADVLQFPAAILGAGSMQRKPEVCVNEKVS
ncbi:hypothetical protein [Sporomusa sphaeroides]|uniref:hypothetical protein n=1 Tax=Sporomusa sphaeroides TaxID=47679 RepID=UPI0031589FA1